MLSYYIVYAFEVLCNHAASFLHFYIFCVLSHFTWCIFLLISRQISMGLYLFAIVKYSLFPTSIPGFIVIVEVILILVILSRIRWNSEASHMNSQKCESMHKICKTSTQETSQSSTYKGLMGWLLFLKNGAYVGICHRQK